MIAESRKERRKEHGRQIACVNACATLKDPENDIRELVLAAREIVQFLPDKEWVDRLEPALSKFEGVK